MRFSVSIFRSLACSLTVRWSDDEATDMGFEVSVSCMISNYPDPSSYS